MIGILRILFPPISARGIINDYLPLLAVYLYTLDIVFSSDIFLLASLAISLPFTISTFMLKKEYNKMFVLFAFMIVGGLLNMANTKNGIGGLFVLIGHFSLAVYCLQNLDRIKWHILIITSIYSVYILYNVLILEVDNRHLFDTLGLSRNHGGGVLTTLTCFFCFSYFFTQKKVPFIVPLLVVWPIFLCSGRSSLAASLILAISCFIFRNNIKSSLIFIVLLIGAAVYFKDIIYEYYTLSRFAVDGTYSERELIWKSYFDHINFIDTFLGPDTTNYPIINLYNGNPHNTFLNMHRRFGLVTCIYFLYLLLATIMKYIKKYPLIITCLICVLCFRAFYDSVFFIGRLDFLFYTIIFYVWSNKNEELSTI